MICACAAYDFFTQIDGFTNDRAEYVYKAIEFDKSTFNFDFNDFVGSENKAGEVFANRLGAFLSFAHIVLAKNGAATKEEKGTKTFINFLKDQKLLNYISIPDEETIEIDNYMKEFAYTFDAQNFVPGWLYQVRGSVLPGRFMFNDKAFSIKIKDISDLDVGALFLDDKHHWSKSFTSSRYDTFCKTLITKGWPNSEQKVNNIKENFLAHIFNAITLSQNF
jgi:hypothetical protein